MQIYLIIRCFYPLQPRYGGHFLLLHQSLKLSLSVRVCPKSEQRDGGEGQVAWWRNGHVRLTVSLWSPINTGMATKRTNSAFWVADFLVMH